MESKCPRGRGGTRDASKRLISRRYKPSSKGDSFRLVRIEDPIVHALVQDCGKLPREVHGIADAGIHALPADWTMNVGGVAQQECAPAAEPVGDSMVHAIGREPVHALDVDPEPVEHAVA